MANNCKQCFNTHYQPHCHPTTKSLWLCSSAYCGPPHPSRRIMVGDRSRQPITFNWVPRFRPCDAVHDVRLSQTLWFSLIQVIVWCFQCWFYSMVSCWNFTGIVQDTNTVIVKITGLQTLADKTQVGPTNLLYMIMLTSGKSSQIHPRSGKSPKVFTVTANY